MLTVTLPQPRSVVCRVWSPRRGCAGRVLRASLVHLARIWTSNCHKYPCSKKHLSLLQLALEHLLRFLVLNKTWKNKFICCPVLGWTSACARSLSLCYTPWASAFTRRSSLWSNTSIPWCNYEDTQQGSATSTVWSTEPRASLPELGCRYWAICWSPDFGGLFLVV